MTFLQPAMLWALPLVLLPIVIHLLHRRRYQTVAWGATQFLVAAKGLSQGHARLRQWLVLLARTLAILGLLLLISRPLSSGRLGAAASGVGVDTVVVLLDRSPSMGHQGAGGRSRWRAAVDRLTESLELSPPRELVLIREDGPLEVAPATALSDLPDAQPDDATTDFAGLFEQLIDYLRRHETGRCDVWIGSDLRLADWTAPDGRWQAIRRELRSLPATTRFRLLAYPQPSAGNRAIRVVSTRRARSEPSDSLPTDSLVLALEIDSEDDAGVRLPVTLRLDGARSEFEVTMTGDATVRWEQTIPLDASRERGWGRVSLPSDTNPEDNDAFFVYDRPAERRVLVVTEEPRISGPLEWAASISPRPEVACAAQVVTAGDADAVDWDSFALVLWHAPIPDPETSADLRRLADRGGRVIFFPPASAAPGGRQGNAFDGLRWGDWQTAEGASGRVARWTRDHDLLASADDGEPLPVAALRVERFRRLDGEGIPLATLANGEPLLMRGNSAGRNVYFCTSTPDPADSDLAENGVVLYAMVQRAAAWGAMSASGATRSWFAGEVDAAARRRAEAGQWEPLETRGPVLSRSAHRRAGVYRDGERLVVVQRPPAEDATDRIPEAQLRERFEGLPFSRIDDQVDSRSALLQEIWRLCLGVMVAAMFLEAGLSLPKASSGSANSGRAGTGSR